MLRSLLRPSSTVLSAHLASSRAIAAALPCALAATPAVAHAVSAASASPFFQTPHRGLVVDRAVKAVSMKRRNRRELLRRIARKESSVITAGVRMTNIPPPLASYEQAVANLNQFLAFIARQAHRRQKKEATGAAGNATNSEVSESTQAARDAATASWQLTFPHMQYLMNTRQNRTFRACEELCGALSDPMTDLGNKGLADNELKAVLRYVDQCMDVTQREMEEKLRAAPEGDFQRMDTEDQYLLAGVHSIRYLVARIRRDEPAVEAALLAARAQNILAPPSTPLAHAMQHDVYPPRDPAALAKSAAWPPQSPASPEVNAAAENKEKKVKAREAYQQMKTDKKADAKQA